MKTSSTLANACIAVALAGCAAQTGVVATGQETFYASKQAATGLPGLGTLKADLIQQSAAHCAGMGRQLEVVSTSETQPPYLLGNYPRAEITFRCVATK